MLITITVTNITFLLLPQDNKMLTYEITIKWGGGGADQSADLSQGFGSSATISRSDVRPMKAIVVHG